MRVGAGRVAQDVTGDGDELNRLISSGQCPVARAAHHVPADVVDARVDNCTSGVSVLSSPKCDSGAKTVL